MGNFRGVRTTFKAFKIAENGLFNQPVRRAINAQRRGFEPLARGLIELDAHGGGAHIRSCYKKVVLASRITIGHVATLCNLVNKLRFSLYYCPFF